MEEFLKALHEAVLNAGAKDLARKMGASHVALLQRSNPHNDSHRLNVEQMFQVLLHSEDMEPLRVLAGEFGFDLVARKAVEPKPLTKALLNMAAEAADVTRVVHDALEDNHISQTEAAAIRREINHARQSLDVLEASVKAA